MFGLVEATHWLQASPPLLLKAAGTGQPAVQRRRRSTACNGGVAVALLLVALAGSLLDSRLTHVDTHSLDTRLGPELLPTTAAGWYQHQPYAQNYNSSAGSPAFIGVRLRKPKEAADADTETVEEELVVKETRRLLNGALVELEEADVPPWRMSKLLVPLVPEVARWWSAIETAVTVKLVPCGAGGEPHVHVQVCGEGSPTLDVGGGEMADGVHVAVQLPHGALAEACRVEWAWITADDVAPLAGLGPVRVLRVVCPIRCLSTALSGATARAALDGLLVRFLLRWLLLPWPLLLLPLVLMSIVRPMVLAGSVLFSHFLQLARRRRRLWRVRALFRRAPLITGGAFGEGEPCCICLGEPSEEEALVALLPCRHTLHIDCYCGWVCTDTYPSPDLICPLCRRKASAVGKLEV